MKVIEEIREIGKLYHAQGCDESQIKKAEKDLNMEFPNEYKEYLKEYGAISFFGTEWTGLNVEDYIDVVRVTVKERELNKNFPLKYFVLENLGIDGLLTIVSENGKVFSWNPDGKINLIAENLVDYLKECERR